MHSFSLNVQRGWGNESGVCVYNQILVSHAWNSTFVTNAWMRSITLYPDRETVYNPWVSFVTNTPPRWFNASLINGTEEDPYMTIQYRKQMNIVYIEGWARKAQQNKTLFILPEGYRPASTVITVTSLNAPSLTYHPTARLIIFPSGSVEFEAVSDINQFESSGASVRCYFTATE